MLMHYSLNQQILTDHLQCSTKHYMHETLKICATYDHDRAENYIKSVC